MKPICKLTNTGCRRLNHVSRLIATNASSMVDHFDSTCSEQMLNTTHKHTHARTQAWINITFASCQKGFKSMFWSFTIQFCYCLSTGCAIDCKSLSMQFLFIYAIQSGAAVFTTRFSRVVLSRSSDAFHTNARPPNTFHFIYDLRFLDITV